MKMTLDTVVKKDIIKSAKIIKQKLRAMKTNRIEHDAIVSDHWKPLIEPLTNIATAVVTDGKKIIEKEDVKNESPNLSFEGSESPSISISGPLSSLPEDLPSIVSGQKVSDYLKVPTKLEIPFGFRKVDGKLFIGNSEAKIIDDVIYVQDKNYKVTPGLLELLFKKVPDLQVIESEDKIKYGLILNITNAHRRDFSPNGQIKGDRSFKYTSIVSKIFSTKSGSGINKTVSQDIDYIHWDDPNELVDRLRLLISSKNAGHTGHDNEIISIIEELKEAKIIK